MKIKKILAGVAAGALAVSSLAVSAFASTLATGNATVTSISTSTGSSAVSDFDVSSYVTKKADRRAFESGGTLTFTLSGTNVTTKAMYTVTFSDAANGDDDSTKSEMIGSGTTFSVDIPEDFVAYDEGGEGTAADYVYGGHIAIVLDDTDVAVDSEGNAIKIEEVEIKDSADNTYVIAGSTNSYCAVVSYSSGIVTIPTSGDLTVSYDISAMDWDGGVVDYKVAVTYLDCDGVAQTVTQEGSDVWEWSQKMDFTFPISTGGSLADYALANVSTTNPQATVTVTAYLTYDYDSFTVDETTDLFVVTVASSASSNDDTSTEEDEDNTDTDDGDSTGDDPSTDNDTSTDDDTSSDGTGDTDSSSTDDKNQPTGVVLAIVPAAVAAAAVVISKKRQ